MCNSRATGCRLTGPREYKWSFRNACILYFRLIMVFYQAYIHMYSLLSLLLVCPHQNISGMKTSITCLLYKRCIATAFDCIHIYRKPSLNILPVAYCDLIRLGRGICSTLCRYWTGHLTIVCRPDLREGLRRGRCGLLPPQLRAQNAAIVAVKVLCRP